MSTLFSASRFPRVPSRSANCWPSAICLRRSCDLVPYLSWSILWNLVVRPPVYLRQVRKYGIFEERPLFEDLRVLIQYFLLDPGKYWMVLLNAKNSFLLCFRAPSFPELKQISKVLNVHLILERASNCRFLLFVLHLLSGAVPD